MLGGHPAQGQPLQRPLASRAPESPPPLRVLRQGRDGGRVAGDVVSGRDEDPHLRGHQLGQARQPRGDERRGHRHRLVGHVGESLERAGQENGVAGRVPRGDRRLIAVEDHPVGEPRLGHPLAHGRPQLAVSEHVNLDVGTGRPQAGGDPHHEKRVLLRGQPCRIEHVKPPGLEVRHGGHPVGRELAFGVDAGADQPPLGVGHLIDIEPIAERLARHGEGVDEGAVPRGDVADVAGVVVLLNVELHHDGRWVREVGDLRQQLEGQAGVHDVNDFDLPRADEGQDEPWETRRPPSSPGGPTPRARRRPPRATGGWGRAGW